MWNALLECALRCSGTRSQRMMVTPIGSLAMINREPGQARKGAATAVDSCAEV